MGALSGRCLLCAMAIEANPLNGCWFSQISPSAKDPHFLSMFWYFILTFSETETSVLPSARAGVTLGVAPRSFIYKLGNVQVWYCLCSGRLATIPAPGHWNAHGSKPSEGLSCQARQQPGGAGSHPGVGRLELMTHHRLAVVTRQLCQGCAAGCLCVGRFGCPLPSTVARESSPVGFGESTIYLSSEASLFLCSGRPSSAQVVVT